MNLRHWPFPAGVVLGAACLGKGRFGRGAAGDGRMGFNQSQDGTYGQAGCPPGIWTS